MQHLVQIIQFAGGGSQECDVGPSLLGKQCWKAQFPSHPSSNTVDLKRSFIMIPSAGQKGNRVNYRLVCRLLIKPQLNIKTQGKRHFPLRASSLSELRNDVPASAVHSVSCFLCGFSQEGPRSFPLCANKTLFLAEKEHKIESSETAGGQ